MTAYLRWAWYCVAAVMAVLTGGQLTQSLHRAIRRLVERVEDAADLPYEDLEQQVQLRYADNGEPLNLARRGLTVHFEHGGRYGIHDADLIAADLVHGLRIAAVRS
jgi:hypothetical protein